MGRIVEPAPGKPPCRSATTSTTRGWLNSPWLDRYDREPHDIYLPTAVGRVTAEGGPSSRPTCWRSSRSTTPTGGCRRSAPTRSRRTCCRPSRRLPTPRASSRGSDPYDAFHDAAVKQPERLDEAFFHDWFIRQAVNGGTPINTVVSDRTFAATEPGVYRDTILLSRVPDAGSDVEAGLLRHLADGGRVLLFGPTDHASETMLDWLGLADAGPIEGDVELSRLAPADLDPPPGPITLRHRSLLCAGPIRNTLRDGAEAEVLATAVADGEQRVVGPHPP